MVADVFSDIVDNAENWRSAVIERDADSEIAPCGDEIRGAIDGIDDPGEAAHLLVLLLLGEKRCFWRDLGEAGFERVLHPDVKIGDQILVVVFLAPHVHRHRRKALLQRLSCGTYQRNCVPCGYSGLALVHCLLLDYACTAVRVKATMLDAPASSLPSASTRVGAATMLYCLASSGSSSA